jgi:DNA-binding response OmpR family regulator
MTAEPPAVLVAEDDAALREVICEALAAAGWRVESYADGDALLNALTYRFDCLGTPPDLVVTDLRMPGGSGLDVLQRLRRFDKVTPVILITAFGDAKTHAAALKLGACHVLDKPFDVDTLRIVADLTGAPS